MKNKLNKIFLTICSIFLLVGGGILSACEKEQPQASIEVSSADFAGDDYIEIDLGSDSNKAVLTAKVSGISSGEISVNNDNHDIISAPSSYDAASGLTTITIIGKDEGDAKLVLTSHGNGEKVINVYVYSDITSLDPSDDLDEQYVVRGQDNILDPNKLLKFGSRANGESNRKDVTWSLETSDTNLSLEGNVLTVGEGYTGETVMVRADSDYTDKRTTITLNVISPLPDISTNISRDSNAFDTEITAEDQTFNLVKNDDSNEESKLYVRLTVPVSAALDVTPRVYTTKGDDASDKLDTPIFNSNTLNGTNEIIYKITAKSHTIEPEKLIVYFDVAYEKYSYSKESIHFAVNLVDVIDQIDVKSNGETITKNDEIKIYDFYNNDSSYQYGHPFLISLGPDTVANALAKYFVEMTVPAGKSVDGLIILKDQYGSTIGFEKVSSSAVGDVYRSEAIDNKTVVYIKAGSSFTNGDSIDCTFVSEQTERVNLPIRLSLYNSPKEDFDIDGEELEYYLSTNKYDTKHIEVSVTALQGIDAAGVKLDFAESDKIDISNFAFNSEEGTISFDASNKVLNIDSANVSVKISHSNGFVSKQEIVISAFIPLQEASVNYKGQMTTAVSKTSYEAQGLSSSEEWTKKDNTLAELIMKTGGTVEMSFISNCNAEVSFKLISHETDLSGTDEELLAALTNATEIPDSESGIVNPINNSCRLTLPSIDVKYYALISFEGFDENHEEITLYRYFYLEGYTAPTRLILNSDLKETGIELFALDSVSADEKDLATQRITLTYRDDNKPITYWESTTSVTGTHLGNYWEYNNLICTDSNISFDITATTTGGREYVVSQIVVSYKIFNTTYSLPIEVTIKNAQRVEKVTYTNENPDDGIIYLDINGKTTTEKTAVILTSIEPSNAYNQDLEYVFIADDGTNSNLISVDELGIVSFKNGATEGGTGYIYVIPKDAVRNVSGVKKVGYFKEGHDPELYFFLSDIGKMYDEICENNYYFKGAIDLSTNAREKICYKDVILKIRIVVADGKTQATATRIYNEAGLKSIEADKHYELMNSLTLGSDWSSISLTTGSLRGHNENITIRFNGSDALFDSIGKDAEVSDLILMGDVSGNGMLANTNEGTIENIKVTIDGSGTDKLQLPKISGTGYVGGIVGINEGTISGSAVEGAVIASSGLTGFVGGIAGKNSGNITECRVEFYNAENKFLGTVVGGIVGELNDGKIEKSYVYAYKTSGILSGPIIGAFAGIAFYGEISNSFAIVAGTYNLIGEKNIVAIGSDGEEKTAADGTTYKINTATISDAYWGYGEDYEKVNNQSNWIADDDKIVQYVRNGEKHLSFYQNQAITEDEFNSFKVSKIYDSEKDITRALPTGEDSGILFISAVKDSSILTDSERSYLRTYNTISIADLLNIGGNLDKVIISSSSSDIEINGSNIILLGKSSSVDIIVTSKYDFTLTKTFTFKILYALDQLTAWHDGIETSGFTVQEGRTDSILFTIKNGIYIGNSGVKHSIKLEDFALETSVEKVGNSDVLQNKVEFNANGMSATILAKSGTKDVLGTGKEGFAANVWISVDNGNETIKDSTLKTIQIYPTKGSQVINVTDDEISMNPEYQHEFKVVLVTDDSADELLLTLKYNDDVLTKDDVNNIFSLNGENRIKIDATKKAYDSKNKKFEYSITISVCENYKHKVSADEQYSLLLTSKTGTASNEGREIIINLSAQAINNIDMTNYKMGGTSWSDGVVSYSMTETAVSVISPGSMSIMQVSIDPTFAHYEYMTLTYGNSDGAAFGITALKSANSAYQIDGTAVNIERGVKLSRNNNGTFNFLLQAAANITKDTVFTITATFYDENGKPVIDPIAYDLYISYLPEAEITINGDISALVAKGGSLDIVMLLKSDQDIESISATNVKGITISPKSTWDVVDNGNGTKNIYAKLYAGLNAGIINSEGKPINGEFRITAVVSRYFNGVREEKTSFAYVTVVDFLPKTAEVKNAVEKDGSDVKVLDSYIGIPVVVDFEYTFDPAEYGYDQSDNAQINLYKDLIQKRSDFQENKSFKDGATGFAINCDSEDNVVPIYKRIKIGNQRANFVKSSTDENVWIFNYTNFRLSYNEETKTMTVLGYSSTSAPVVLTLVDEISVASSGKAIKYTIETQFAIDVVTYSDPDLPLVIRDDADFLKVEKEGTKQNYILLNDITLKNYTPISAEMFEVLDGNGYTINIESFDMSGSGSLNLALFTNVPSTTTIKNLKVNYYNGGQIDVDTTSSGYSSIFVAGLAINNAGIITNTQVVAYQNADAEIAQTGSVGLQVNLLRGSTPYYIDNYSTITAEVAGFVLNNSGSITNSRVGGDSIIVIGDQIEANYTYYSNQQLEQFVLSGQGNMAGFALRNTGSIVASGASNIQITNNSTAIETSTAGFVMTNSSDIRTSYIEGSVDEKATTQYHLTGSNISASGKVAGFVVNNGEKGVIENSYSNIYISNKNDAQSRASAGFVYENEGKIAYSYSASKVEKANILQSNFSGIDRNGNSLNSGKIELSYYYIEDYADDSSDDVQELVENQASRINKDAVDSENSYYGFIFNSSDNVEDGIWEINTEARRGIKLICRDQVTISHRYYHAINEDEYELPYSILKNSADTAGKEYNTALGNDCNPILISSAKEFKEAMGESKWIYVKKFYDDHKVFGSYRFVKDITLSDLNDKLGNAEVSSIDKTFTGKLDGNGFSIKNISIKSSNDSVGLFGEINGAVVKNLSLEVDNITASDSYTVGTLTGLAERSIISNISLTQKTVTEGASKKGILGKNITGGIIGSVFEDCYITGLSTQDVIVQSTYYSNGSRADDYLKLDSKTLRKHEKQNRSKFFSDEGVGTLSFAGSIIGYSDIYTSNEFSSDGFVYSQNMNDSQYAIKQLSVSGTIDVRGEVVGGAIGFTGINTKAKDISVTVSKNSGTTNNILSYNAIAGAIVGYANGQFHQIYAEHDETTQDKIEASTKDYYVDGKTAERGELELFKFNTSQDAGTYKYEPIYVGGLVGTMGSGSISVSYSKINAINYTEGGYAGGIAGYVKGSGSSQFSVPVDALEKTDRASLYLNEVYASGDVYAISKQIEKTEKTEKTDETIKIIETVGGFAGLFGKFDDPTRLVMISVNAVNHYGMAIENGINEVYAIATNANSGNVIVYPSIVATEGTSADINSVKSFGYMSEYNKKGAKSALTVIPYDSFDEKSDFFFKIASASTFTSVQDGCTETNGAFIDSDAWDPDNWMHSITDLYPKINLANKLNYIYLDVYNKESVVAKMQNSSIEVRVRGRVTPDGNEYQNVDLSGMSIKNFSGRLIGATDGTWGQNFLPIVISGDIMGYPGIIVDGTLFEGTGAGVSISDLNIIVKATSGDVEITNGLISNAQVIRAKFENISLFVMSKVVVSSDTSASGNIGLLVPSAKSTSFKNIAFYYCIDANDNIVEFAQTKDSSIANVGLLAGEIEQASTYDALKIQNITIKLRNENSILMSASVGADKSNVGLYVGKVVAENGSAGVELTAKAPELLSKTEISANPQIVVNEGGENVSLNFGGYYGSIEDKAASAKLTFTKDKSYEQWLTLVNNSTTSSTNEGGLIGEAQLQNLTFISGKDVTNEEIIHTKLEFDKEQTNINAGILFGNITALNNITAGKIVGEIFSKDKNVTLTNANIGGLIGENNTTTTFSDTELSLKVYGGSAEGTLKSSAITTGATNTLALGGNSSFGGFIGKNTSRVTANGDIVFNKGGENIAISSTASKSTVYFGDFIGHNGDTATVNSFVSNSVAYIYAEKVSVGGVIGYSQTTTGVTTTIGEESENTINVTSNYFISNPSALNAGGMIGELAASSTTSESGTTYESGTYTIQNTIFGGAFKVIDVDGGTDSIGGIVGAIGANISSATVQNNVIYGDAIYTYNGVGQLGNYYFGGVVGKAESTPTISNNIIAFTNNNSRKATDITNANAVVGNNDSIGADYNSYCSQIVLATNEHATDCGYDVVTANGYGSIDTRNSIIEKLGSYINVKNLSDGHKLKPIGGVSHTTTDGDGTATAASDVSIGNLNGITYYTGAYPTDLKDNTLTNAAFIGDFVDIASSDETDKYSPIGTIGQHAFVSGVVVTSNVSDISKKIFTENVGGIAEKLCGGIIFACKSMGTLSIGGTSKVNVGGIVGQINIGRIAECYSAVDIVYRAGKDDTKEDDAKYGTAAGIAVAATTPADSNNKATTLNFIDNSYSTGKVESYISANLYAFTNGTSTSVCNSYTISYIGAKDHTSEKDSTGTLGIFGDATCTDCSYDKDATECTTNVSGNKKTADKDTAKSTTNVSGSETVSDTVKNVSYADGAVLKDLTSGWVASIDKNYGYMRRNFGAFDVNSYETIGEIDYYLIPNATKLYQMNNTSTKGSIMAYKLTRDIDLLKTSKVNTEIKSTKDSNDKIISSDYTTKNSPINISGKTFDGDGHTIRNNNATLFSNVGTLKNLRVEGYMSGNTGITGSAVVANEVDSADNVIATGLLNGNATGVGSVGGLFKAASKSITNCKNYVKIDVTTNGVKDMAVGGIVGYVAAISETKTDSFTISKCFNYAPINVANYTGADVGGIIGHAGESTSNGVTIEYCGNENTVFNGYTNTIDKDSSKDTHTGDYKAAGIVGRLSKGSVSYCYNTAMIKAGNKALNSAKDSGTSYAAGIVAYNEVTGTDNVKNCYNMGYIEALGDHSDANMTYDMDVESQDVVEDVVEDVEYDTYAYLYSLTYNSGEIKNVAANAICASNDNQGETNKNSATVYKNGLYSSMDLAPMISGYRDYYHSSSRNNGLYIFIKLPENSVMNNYNGNGIYINSDVELMYNAVDGLGAPTSFYLKCTRYISYGSKNSSVTRDQVRYTKTLAISGYEYYAYTNGKDTIDDDTIRNIRTPDSSNVEEIQKTVEINGSDYAFVENSGELEIALKGNYYHGTLEINTVGGEYVSDLVNAGYDTFTINVTYPNYTLNYTIGNDGVNFKDGTKDTSGNVTGTTVTNGGIYTYKGITYVVSSDNSGLGLTRAYVGSDGKITMPDGKEITYEIVSGSDKKQVKFTYKTKDENEKEKETKATVDENGTYTYGNDSYTVLISSDNTVSLAQLEASYIGSNGAINIMDEEPIFGSPKLNSDKDKITVEYYFSKKLQGNDFSYTINALRSSKTEEVTLSESNVFVNGTKVEITVGYSLVDGQEFYVKLPETGTDATGTGAEDDYVFISKTQSGVQKLICELDDEDEAAKLAKSLNGMKISIDINKGRTGTPATAAFNLTPTATTVIEKDAGIRSSNLTYYDGTSELYKSITVVYNNSINKTDDPCFSKPVKVTESYSTDSDNKRLCYLQYAIYGKINSLNISCSESDSGYKKTDNSANGEYTISNLTGEYKATRYVGSTPVTMTIDVELFTYVSTNNITYITIQYTNSDNQYADDYEYFSITFNYDNDDYAHCNTNCDISKSYESIGTLSDGGSITYEYELSEYNGVVNNATTWSSKTINGYTIKYCKNSGATKYFSYVEPDSKYLTTLSFYFKPKYKLTKVTVDAPTGVEGVYYVQFNNGDYYYAAPQSVEVDDNSALTIKTLKLDYTTNIDYDRVNTTRINPSAGIYENKLTLIGSANTGTVNIDGNVVNYKINDVTFSYVAKTVNAEEGKTFGYNGNTYTVNNIDNINDSFELTCNGNIGKFTGSSGTNGFGGYTFDYQLQDSVVEFKFYKEQIISVGGIFTYNDKKYKVTIENQSVVLKSSDESYTGSNGTITISDESISYTSKVTFTYTETTTEESVSVDLGGTFTFNDKDYTIAIADETVELTYSITGTKSTDSNGTGTIKMSADKSISYSIDSDNDQVTFGSGDDTETVDNGDRYTYNNITYIVTISDDKKNVQLSATYTGDADQKIIIGSEGAIKISDDETYAYDIIGTTKSNADGSTYVVYSGQVGGVSFEENNIIELNGAKYWVQVSQEVVYGEIIFESTTNTYYGDNGTISIAEDKIEYEFGTGKFCSLSYTDANGAEQQILIELNDNGVGSFEYNGVKYSMTRKNWRSVTITSEDGSVNKAINHKTRKVTFAGKTFTYKDLSHVAFSYVNSSGKTESKAIALSDNKGTFTYDGTEYTVTRNTAISTSISKDDNGKAVIKVSLPDDVTIEPYYELRINYFVPVKNSIAEIDLVHDLQSVNFVYPDFIDTIKVKENATSNSATIVYTNGSMVSENNKITSSMENVEDSTTYTGSDNKIKISEQTISYSIDVDNNKVTFTYETKDENGKEATSTTIVADGGTYTYNDITYTVTISDDKKNVQLTALPYKKVNFLPSDSPITYNVVAEYKKMSTTADTEFTTNGNGSKGYKGAILTKDIDFGVLKEPQSVGVRLMGDGHIINYFTASESTLFAKVEAQVTDLRVAGTVASNIQDYARTSLFSNSIKANVTNLSVYGSISPKTLTFKGALVGFNENATTRINHNGSIFFWNWTMETTSNVTLSKINNFASYSFCFNDYDATKHSEFETSVIREIQKSKVEYFNNYGTIIGANGADGRYKYTDENGNIAYKGAYGQSIYLAAGTFLSTDGIINNYGIVKAGDGGNGGAPKSDEYDKYVEYDSIATNAAPSSFKTVSNDDDYKAADGGSAGTVYATIGVNSETGEPENIAPTGNIPIPASEGKTGYAGNKAWGGLNLSKVHNEITDNGYKISFGIDGDNYYANAARGESGTKIWIYAKYRFKNGAKEGTFDWYDNYSKNNNKNGFKFTLGPGHYNNREIDFLFEKLNGATKLTQTYITWTEIKLNGGALASGKIVLKKGTKMTCYVTEGIQSATCDGETIISTYIGSNQEIKMPREQTIKYSIDADNKNVTFTCNNDSETVAINNIYTFNGVEYKVTLDKNGNVQLIAKETTSISW